MKLRKTKMEEALESFDDGPAGSRDLQSETPTPVDALMKKELRELLDAAILKLPMDYRVVFVLRDIEGKSTEETAEILRLSVEATKSRLRRARAFLREKLQHYVIAERS
jgi:RNA polymerase sigma-70 factor, ECF subfamily